MQLDIRTSLASLSALALFTPCAVAQVDPSGIDFVTIGAVNNPAYSGPDFNNTVTGRGSVSYEYRIGRTEVTTAQWLEFYNNFYGRVPHLTAPVRWGAFDRGQGQSPRFALSNFPDADLFPVSGPSWRTAAMFCNWLHNDKSTDLSAVMNGAYDVSTFGYEPGTSIFTDQHTRHPDAKYWIPSFDEWIKAGFYDPNHGGQDVGGWWWNTPAATNVPLIHGPPGQGQANTGFDLPGGGHYRIPLGAYPDVQSPWGLLDMAGATAEFTESVRTVGGEKYRRIAGTHWTSSVTGVDAIYMTGGEFPSSPSLFNGLRVAAAVPSPGTALVFVGSLAGCVLRRRRCCAASCHKPVGKAASRGKGFATLASLALFTPCAIAQVDPSGIDFVTIGAVNNPAYSGPDNNFAVTGRGSVSYEYRIGRTEVTTAQWLEFYNLFYGRVPHLTAPVRWGAFDRGQGQSPRFALSNFPDADLFPVSGPSWRTAAMFCNWLHNDKSTDLSAVMNGAYDVSTFGYESPTSSVFTDQHTRHPDAKYWIPSLDEWIKAGFYDPNHGGQGVGGWWWNTPATTNVPLIHGPPGQGEANTGFDLPGGGHYRIPLGAYPDVQSPWGMLDMAGATREFTESVQTIGGVKYRYLAGTHWTGGVVGIDAIYMIGSDFPSLPSLFHGLRVAAAVPSPGTALVIMGSLVGCVLRRRRCGTASCKKPVGKAAP